MKPFTFIAILIFALVAVLHFLRFIFNWEIIINGAYLPRWISVFAIILPAFLAFMLWREMKKKE
jgi:Na+/proline symporter